MYWAFLARVSSNRGFFTVAVLGVLQVPTKTFWIDRRPSCGHLCLFWRLCNGLTFGFRGGIVCLNNAPHYNDVVTSSAQVPLLSSGTDRLVFWAGGWPLAARSSPRSEAQFIRAAFVSFNFTLPVRSPCDHLRTDNTGAVLSWSDIHQRDYPHTRPTRTLVHNYAKFSQSAGNGSTLVGSWAPYNSTVTPR
jgi:hypothetical protein